MRWPGAGIPCDGQKRATPRDCGTFSGLEVGSMGSQTPVARGRDPQEGATGGGAGTRAGAALTDRTVPGRPAHPRSGRLSRGRDRAANHLPR
ncbi:hypothetical protein KRM28CT15_23080 [Krasilnikovia sp. M28-CT-15]